MATSKLQIIISASDQASGILGRIGGAISSMAKVAAGLAVTGVVAGTAALTAFGISSVKAASNLEESMNKVSVVFGKSSKDVVAWSLAMASGFGQSQQQSLEAAGTFGNLFQAMGLGEKETLTMSKSLVELASDLASFNNIPIDEALLKLRAGLVGEIEPLRTLGVTLSAAAIEAKAVAMGLITMVVSQGEVESATNKVKIAQMELNKAYKDGDPIKIEKATERLRKAQDSLAEAQMGNATDLTAAQKAQAAYALILEQTTTAQGDFERTSTGLANSQRIIAALLENTSAKIGMSLLPMVRSLANTLATFLASDKFQSWVSSVAAWITSGLVPAIESVVAWLTTNLPLAIQTVSTWWTGTFIPALAAFGVYWTTTLQPALADLWLWLSTNLPPAIASLSEFWTTQLQPALAAFSVFWTTQLYPALFGLFTWLENNKTAINNLSSPLTTFQTTFAGTTTFLETTVKPTLVGIKTSFDNIKTAISGVITKIAALITKLTGITLPSWLTPGSPTPFEMGLLGIIGAVDTLAGSSIPRLSKSLGGLQNPLTAMPGAGPAGAAGFTSLRSGMAGANGAGAGTTVIYSPVFSAASMHEFEQQLVPLIDRQLSLNQRRRVERNK